MRKTTLCTDPAPVQGFPFSALVGHPELRHALLLAAVDPAVGGVLISGPRGTAKSTAARALAALLPGAPFVSMPLAASVEQLVGTLNLEDVLRDGQVRLAPGMLARAHGGVLYVDEVNLLPDALVDALLDVAASGVNTVERDGISHRHAARFVLVGTMNPEEGELRPQLLDRFGLSVTLDNPSTLQLRQAIVRARLEFDRDPEGVQQRQSAAQAELVRRLSAAQALLPELDWPDTVIAHATGLALRANVDGVRGDLVLLKAARAYAAWHERKDVSVADVDAVAELALAHRRQQLAASPPTVRAPAPQHTAANSPSASASPPEAEGDWGALPPQQEGMAKLPKTGGLTAKKF